MIIAHYAHRLPADYDVEIIRRRAHERGPLWDKVPELHFKGFLLRERGRFGAIASEYSSLYLWRRDEAFRDFLVTGRYKSVTDSLAGLISRPVWRSMRAEDPAARPISPISSRRPFRSMPT
jgi:hypothetical protein